MKLQKKENKNQDTVGYRNNRNSYHRHGGSRGLITVFVTLIMVPVVAITGVLVDVSRLKMYSSQAAMAADSYGNAVLSEFDHLLKQLYGLFSITQNDEGLAAVEKMAEYASASFYPTEDGKALSGFMPYKDAEMEIVWEGVEGASLSNHNVLMTQISDFMKYRIVEEVLDETGILGTLGQFESLSADSEVMETRNELTENSTDALNAIQEYYEELKKIAAYPSYLDVREQAFLLYSNGMKEILQSDEYENYVFYLEHEEEVKAAIEIFESLEEDSESDTSEDITEQLELYERFKDFDKDAYVEELQINLGTLSSNANNNESTPIDFDHVDTVIDRLGEITNELDGVLKEISEQVESIKAQLPDCSDDIRSGMTSELQEMEEILQLSDEFGETYQLILMGDSRGSCKELNTQNRDFIVRYVPDLDQVKDEILAGEKEPKSDDTRLYGNVMFAWYDFREDGGKEEFYSQLQKLCESQDGEGGDKDAGDKEKARAEEAREKAEAELNQDEATDARDISQQLAAQLEVTGASSGEIPGFTEYFNGGLSFDALSKAGSNLLGKFLVTSYDFGMFSSRVTGKEIEEPDTGIEEPETSLTGIKMSPEVNYLYGAELEYLFGGHNRSVSNLNETRNIICGVRMALNFGSTYSIVEINSAINAIANAAAAAVAASGIGAAAAPLVRISVSGALRLAVASIETAADWNALKDREDVVLYKSRLLELQSIDLLSDLLKVDLEKTGSMTGDKNKLSLSYEDYLYVLLFLFVDDNTLLSRTGNLITLNVNQAQNGGDQLDTLDFNMKDTITAVKATCKVKADFVVLPDHFAELFYSGTDTESMIELLEDQYFGYSVIRGY